MLCDVLTANYYLCFVVGGVLNALLLWLMHVRGGMGKEMNAYRPIQMQICAIDVTCLLLGVLVQPVYLMVGATNEMVASGWLVARWHPGSGTSRRWPLGSSPTTPASSPWWRSSPTATW